MSSSSVASDVHACAAVLWGMVERFPQGRRTRDEFDTISSAALKCMDRAATSPQSSESNRPPSLNNRIEGISHTSGSPLNNVEQDMAWNEVDASSNALPAASQRNWMVDPELDMMLDHEMTFPFVSEGNDWTISGEYTRADGPSATSHVEGPGAAASLNHLAF
jgi:hypothetical protein